MVITARRVDGTAKLLEDMKTAMVRKWREEEDGKLMKEGGYVLIFFLVTLLSLFIALVS